MISSREYPIAIYWSDEDAMYIAEVFDLPGCVTHGKTREKALKQAVVAAQGWLEVATEEGREIPEPSKRRKR